MKILITSVLASFLFSTSIYTLQYQNIDGVTQSMNQFQGKKILLVNIATGSNRVAQIGQLQQLQNLYPDSLVVIGFPSNSFGREPKTDSEIKQFCQNNYSANFRLSSKQPVTGVGAQSIFHWLATVSENGVIANPIQTDFQKFLISETGQVIGVFAPAISPLSDEIKNAINNN